MVAPKRPGKRLREDEVESFFDGSIGRDGSYLRLKFQGEKSFKSKGWPWIQSAIRNVLGQEKVEKANILRDGCLLLKTKNKAQTEKLLKVSNLLGEDCEVVRDEKLNMSRGTIHSYDLLELSEDEVVQWLSEYGVTHAKRYTRRVGGSVEGTPTLLLTFDMPSCPTKIQLDYVTYHVKKYIPNPLLCYRCGKFGHSEARCTNEERCLTCGESKHDGECVAKCLNCSQLGHSCLSRECAVWQKEKDICTLKVEQEIPYGQARKLYEDTHHPPSLQGYAEAVRLPSAIQPDPEMKEKVDRLERKIDEMANVLTQLAAQLNTDRETTVPAAESEKGVPTGELEQMDRDSVTVPGGNKVQPGEQPKTTVPRKDVSRVLAWKGGKGRSRGKEGRKSDIAMEECTDDSLPSQVIGRSSSLERGHNQPGTSGRRSWKEAT